MYKSLEAAVFLSTEQIVEDDLEDDFDEGWDDDIDEE